MSNNGTLLMVICLIMSVVFFGGYYGVSINNPLSGIDTQNPSLFSVTFLWQLMTFTMDGMPVAISAIFDVMAIMMLYLGLKLVRGTN